jgi:hypothetical protein
MSFVVVISHPDLLRYVESLRAKNSDALGSLPRVVFERAAKDICHERQQTGGISRAAGVTEGSCSRRSYVTSPDHHFVRPVEVHRRPQKS